MDDIKKLRELADRFFRPLVCTADGRHTDWRCDIISLRGFAIALAAAPTPPAEPVQYGCHCDLEPDMKPDGCVLDYGRPEDCVNASALVKAGKGREACHEWKPVTFAHPAPTQQEADARDAARYRWLRDQRHDDGIAIVMKNKHIKPDRPYADIIDGYIDAAMGEPK